MLNETRGLFFPSQLWVRQDSHDLQDLQKPKSDEEASSLGLYTKGSLPCLYHVNRVNPVKLFCRINN